MRFLTTGLTLLLLAASPAFALVPKTPEHFQSLKIKDAIFHRQYDTAEKLTRDLNLPSHAPLPTLISMTIVQFKMSENLKFDNGTAFLREAGANERACEPIIKNEKADVWDLMVCASGESLRSLYFVKTGETIKGFNAASRALKIFERVKKEDPENIDVELAQAMYDYFKSEFTQTKLAFLPFFKDHRNEALKKIRDISVNGVFAKDIADFATGLIAVESENKILGDMIFPKLTSGYPDSVLFKIMQSALMIKSKDYQKAVAVIESIQQLAPDVPTSKYFMGRALALEGKDLPGARKWLNEYILTSPDASVKGPSYYLLGLVSEKEGKLDEALDYYKKGYDVYPKYKPSLKSLLRLKNSKKS